MTMPARGLWLLRPVADLPAGDDPWEPWFDKSFGFVICAETEQEARRIAHENAGDENRNVFCQKKTSNTTTPWLDPRYSTCKSLSAARDVAPGLVMQDFHSA